MDEWTFVTTSRYGSRSHLASLVGRCASRTIVLLKRKLPHRALQLFGTNKDVGRMVVCYKSMGRTRTMNEWTFVTLRW